MLSRSFARSARSLRPATRASMLYLRGSRPISTLPENPQIVLLPPHTACTTNRISVCPQRPLRPHKIPPLPPPHNPADTTARHRHRSLNARHAPELHVESPIRPVAIKCIRRTRAPRPHGPRPSRRLCLTGRFQPLAPERRSGRREPPRRCRGREHGGLDPCF